MQNPNSDGSLNFVWGHVGKKLQKLDNQRYLAIGQNSAHEYLSRIYNKNMQKHIKLLPDKADEYLIAIEHENELDNLFRQIALFMRGNSDMVSIGSFVTGQLEKSVKTGKIVTKIKDLENDKSVIG